MKSNQTCGLDTSLIINNQKYFYLVKNIHLSANNSSILSIDTLYKESGVWHIEFLDFNNTGHYEYGAEEDYYFFTNADSSTIPANINRKTFFIRFFTKKGEETNFEKKYFYFVFYFKYLFIYKCLYF